MHARDERSRWPFETYQAFKQARIRQVSYVPDAGHAELIRLCEDDPELHSIVLTTEEEGIAMAAGAWLGGHRSSLLMQSSGVGNCINMLSLTAAGRFPLLMIVTMRGEWHEFNPWQIPMGRATRPSLELLGVTVCRAETADEVPDIVTAGAELAFAADQRVAVLLAQRVLGKKEW